MFFSSNRKKFQIISQIRSFDSNLYGSNRISNVLTLLLKSQLRLGFARHWLILLLLLLLLPLILIVWFSLMQYT